jgi:hypothetical protein
MARLKAAMEGLEVMWTTMIKTSQDFGSQLTVLRETLAEHNLVMKEIKEFSFIYSNNVRFLDTN